MLGVYIIEGWFGDQEWIEGVYASSETAEAKCEKLWESRRSSVIPEDHYVQGLCKFAVVYHGFADG